MEVFTVHRKYAHKERERAYDIHKARNVLNLQKCVLKMKTHTHSSFCQGTKHMKNET